MTLLDRLEDDKMLDSYQVAEAIEKDLMELIGEDEPQYHASGRGSRAVRNQFRDKLRTAIKAYTRGKR